MYFYEHKHQLRNREDYKEIYDSRRNIYEKYPEIRALFEDSESSLVSKEIKDEIEEVLGTYSLENKYDRKESFKLGFKEAFVFLKEQGMLKI